MLRKNLLQWVTEHLQRFSGAGAFRKPCGRALRARPPSSYCFLVEKQRSDLNLPIGILQREAPPQKIAPGGNHHGNNDNRNAREKYKSKPCFCGAEGLTRDSGEGGPGFKPRLCICLWVRLAGSPKNHSCVKRGKAKPAAAPPQK
jgi:hypothetical protein